MGSITKHLDQSHSQNMSNQNRLLATATILLFVVSSHTFKISTRDYCPPKPKTMNPFDTSKFLGDWYQVSGLPAFFQPEGTTCIRATYGEMDYGKISVRNVAINPAGSFDEICGYAEVPNPAYPGELLVHFPFSPPGDYWLLDTDYENFASVYACTDVLGLLKIEFAWILVRDPYAVSFDTMNSALSAFKAQNLTTANFLPVSNEGCTFENPSGGDPCTGGNWGK